MCLAATETSARDQRAQPIAESTCVHSVNATERCVKNANATPCARLIIPPLARNLIGVCHRLVLSGIVRCMRDAGSCPRERRMAACDQPGSIGDAPAAANPHQPADDRHAEWRPWWRITERDRQAVMPGHRRRRAGCRAIIRSVSPAPSKAASPISLRLRLIVRISGHSPCAAAGRCSHCRDARRWARCCTNRDCC